MKGAGEKHCRAVETDETFRGVRLRGAGIAVFVGFVDDDQIEAFRHAACDVGREGIADSAHFVRARLSPAFVDGDVVGPPMTLGSFADEGRHAVEHFSAGPAHSPPRDERKLADCFGEMARPVLGVRLDEVFQGRLKVRAAVAREIGLRDLREMPR